MKPVAGRSTDAAPAGDVGPPSSVTGPYRRRRAGLWGATTVGPELRVVLLMLMLLLVVQAYRLTVHRAPLPHAVKTDDTSDPTCSAKTARPLPRPPVVLNNFVTELNLSNFLSSSNSSSTLCFRIQMLREGWIFIRSTADTIVTIDANETIVPHGRLEGMRKLAVGPHLVSATPSYTEYDTTEGNSLILRLIPEIIYTELGYQAAGPGQSWIRHYGPYNWAHMQRIGIADNVNVVLERSRTDTTFDAVDWRTAQGKRVLTYANVATMTAALPTNYTSTQAKAYLANLDGFKSSDRDGCVLDELGYGLADEFYKTMAGAVKLLSADPQLRDKVLQPYTAALYYDIPGNRNTARRQFVEALVSAGYAFMEENYLHEQPSEAEVCSK